MKHRGGPKKTHPRFSSTALLLLLSSGAFVGVLVTANRGTPDPPVQRPELYLKSAPHLSDLLKTTPEALSTIDVAPVNLACAEGLPGSESLNTTHCLETLDTWAARVKAETERHLYRFKNNPAEYENSEGYFRMLMMAVVLYEDFGVHYNPARISGPDQNAALDFGFFADSADLFLHGLCGPRRQGTCSSMPVLYAALGRRLGYPLKLATTKAHIFLRWENQTERFNLEATGRGMNKYDDEHFKQWPFPVSEEEIRADGFLKSLSPAEELALFLSLRAHCLRAAGRPAEAARALEHAIKLAPESRPYRLLLADLHGNVVQTSPPSPFNPGPVSPDAPTSFTPDPKPLRRLR